MLFNQAAKQTIRISYNSNTIKQIMTIKYLSITINGKFTFPEHKLEIVKKVNQRNRAIYPNLCPPENLLFYFILISIFIFSLGAQCFLPNLKPLQTSLNNVVGNIVISTQYMFTTIPTHALICSTFPNLIK